MADSIPITKSQSQPSQPILQNNNPQKESISRPYFGIGILILVLAILLAYFILPGLPLIFGFIPVGQFAYVILAILCLGISAGVSYGLYFIGVSRIFMASHLIVALPLAITFGFTMILGILSEQLSKLSSVEADGQAGASSGLVSLFGPSLNLIVVLVILVVFLHAFSIIFFITGKEKPSLSMLVAFVGVVLIVIVYLFSTIVTSSIIA